MIDVVIVNWNSGAQIQACVSSLIANEADCRSSLFIVDNASQDGSMAPFTDDDRVSCIVLGENLGFAKACNIGALRGRSEYLLFLNPDAAVFPETLTRSIAFMQKSRNANVGICGVQLLDETNQVSRSCSRFPSLSGFLAHSLGLDYVFPRLNQRMAHWNHGQSCEVDQVIGAYFLVRRAVFESLGGFDERFFMYFEEVDFSYRARLAGWRSVYLADVQAFHAGGGSSRQIKGKRLFYSLRSRLLYAFKHFHPAAALLVLCTTVLLEPLSRSAFAMSRRSWPALRETWSGYTMLWRWLPQWLIHGRTR